MKKIFNDFDFDLVKKGLTLSVHDDASDDSVIVVDALEDDQPIEDATQAFFETKNDLQNYLFSKDFSATEIKECESIVEFDIRYEAIKIIKDYHAKDEFCDVDMVGCEIEKKVKEELNADFNADDCYDMLCECMDVVYEEERKSGC